MVSRRALHGALRVNLLICIGLREDCGIRVADAAPPASGVRPGFVRRLSGVVRVTKCYPCGELQSRCAMEYDQDKVDEMVLALLSLTMFEEDQDGARAWKGHDWVAMDRLHTKGYVSDPKSKAKSVVVTVKGVQRSPELFEKHFGKKEPEAH
jgi:hypothetical protein